MSKRQTTASGHGPMPTHCGGSAGAASPVVAQQVDAEQIPPGGVPEAALPIGGANSNTPPSNNHPGYRVTVDTVRIGFGVRWTTSTWDKLSFILNEAKQAAQSVTDGSEHTLTIGSHVWRVLPRGLRAGDGHLVAQFALEAEGVVYAVANRQNPVGDTPNVMVYAGGVACMQNAGDIYSTIRARVAGLGGAILWDCLSRIDIAVDLADWPVADFAAAVRERRVISRALKRCEFGFFENGTHATGVSFGKSPLMIRAYDKLEELRHDPVKRALWVSRVWGGEPAGDVTRVECELGRDTLKSLGVRTWAAWSAKRSSVCEYVYGKWCRWVNESAVGSGHQTRATESEPWQRLRAALRASWGFATPADRLMLEGNAQVRELVNQAWGCLAGAMAHLGTVPDSRSTCLHQARFLIEKWMPEVEHVVTRVARRTLQLSGGGRSRFSMKEARALARDAMGGVE